MNIYIYKMLTMEHHGGSQQSSRQSLALSSFSWGNRFSRVCAGRHKAGSTIHVLEKPWNLYEQKSKFGQKYLSSLVHINVLHGFCLFLICSYMQKKQMRKKNMQADIQI